MQLLLVIRMHEVDMHEGICQTLSCAWRAVIPALLLPERIAGCIVCWHPSQMLPPCMLMHATSRASHPPCVAPLVTHLLLHTQVSFQP